MNSKDSNIFPAFDRIMTREDKEKLLNQRSKVLWITGLSGSGKTTLASGLEQELNTRGYLSQVLDGDNIRTGISNNLGFSEDERMENVRRISEVSKLFLNCGIITINCLISPTIQIRELALSILGRENFILIYLNASLDVCEARDIKGLYKKARKGIIKNFTGIDSPYEVPLHPDLVVNTGSASIKESVDKTLEFILPRIKY